MSHAEASLRRAPGTRSLRPAPECLDLIGERLETRDESSLAPMLVELEQQAWPAREQLIEVLGRESIGTAPEARHPNGEEPWIAPRERQRAQLITVVLPRQ